jgi:hypothetical protein
MEPLENRELNDRDLDVLLREWKTPSVPARLRERVFGEPDRPWWRKIWSASIRIPAPVAVCLALALALGAWRWIAPAPARVVTKTERVEVPVVTERVITLYRERPAAIKATAVPVLRPVTELRPRIIRNRNEEN